MTAWLSIIGIGDDGLGGLGETARNLIDQAEMFVGGKRHLDMLADDPRPRLEWPSPFSKLVGEVMDRRGQNICILATGDPMHYGVGVTFAGRLPIDEMTIIPAPSAFSLAAARLGWNLARTSQITLHGRALSRLVPHLQANGQILALSKDGTTPKAVAEILCAHGYGDSEITVLEHMGGKNERQRRTSAGKFDLDDIQDLNVIAIQCPPVLQNAGAATSSPLGDDAFVHDGQLTKSETRAITLASLAPAGGEMLWDIGAGSGSVAIEWMRSDPWNRAIAFEKSAARLELIQQNKDALGVPDLKIIAGDAPQCLEDQPAPDAIFIGGGLSADGLLQRCFDSLRPGGRLVANAVTIEGEQILFQAHEQWGGDLTRVDISRAQKMGGFTGWKPFRQITHYVLVKT